MRQFHTLCRRGIGGVLFFVATIIYAVNFSSGEQLNRYSLNQLKMVGSIDNQQQIWGIVRAPDQQVYRIVPGAKLGIEQAKVIEVTGQRITMEYMLKTGQMVLKTLWLSGN